MCSIELVRSLHPRYRREWRLAPGSSVQLERLDEVATQGDGYSYSGEYTDDEDKVHLAPGEVAFEVQRQRYRGQSVGVTLNI